MGHYAYTCAVSNLPIQGGDPVRFLLLVSNGARDWYPRTFPLRAVYSSYGSVVEVEEGHAQDLWLEGFQADLVSRGWGDNSIHEIAINKNLTFEHLLVALRKERILVRPPSYPSRRVWKVPKEVPTLRKVQARLAKAGLPLFQSYVGAKLFWSKGFLVDRKGYGTIRVRWKGDNLVVALKKAQKVLKKDFATVIRAGTGNYPYPADLFVHTKPGGCPERPKSSSKKPLPVLQAMIREDVWQALLKLRAGEGKLTSLQDFRDHIFKGYKKAQSEGLEPNLYLPEALTSQWKLFLAKKVPFHKAKSFLSYVAEMAHVYWALTWIRYSWYPSSSQGPQDPQAKAWENHAVFHAALTRICQKEMVK